MFDRKVTRIITPGTLIDEKFMNPYENNYLLAIVAGTIEQGTLAVSGTDDCMGSTTSSQFGLAWLDLSTGDFYTQTTIAGNLSSAVARIGAREIVLNKPEAIDSSQGVTALLDPQRHLVTYHSPLVEGLPVSEWTPMLETAVSPEVQEQFTSEEVTAGSLLLSYVKEKLQGIGIRLQPPVRRQESETMTIDKNSLRGLEVLETSKEGVNGGKGSLLHSVRRTVTKGGTRLLKNWIGMTLSLNFPSLLASIFKVYPSLIS